MRHPTSPFTLLVAVVAAWAAWGGCDAEPYQGPATVQGPSGPIEVNRHGVITVHVVDGARAPLRASQIAARSQDVTVAEASVVRLGEGEAQVAEVRVEGKKPGRATIDLKYTHPGRVRLEEASVEVEVVEPSP